MDVGREHLQYVWRQILVFQFKQTGLLRGKEAAHKHSQTPRSVCVYVFAFTCVFNGSVKETINHRRPV